MSEFKDHVLKYCKFPFNAVDLFLEINFKQNKTIFTIG